MARPSPAPNRRAFAITARCGARSLALRPRHVEGECARAMAWSGFGASVSHKIVGGASKTPPSDMQAHYRDLRSAPTSPSPLTTGTAYHGQSCAECCCRMANLSDVDACSHRARLRSSQHGPAGHGTSRTPPGGFARKRVGASFTSISAPPPSIKALLRRVRKVSSAVPWFALASLQWPHASVSSSSIHSPR